MANLDFDATQPQKSLMDYLTAIDNITPTEESVYAYLHALHADNIIKGIECPSVEQFFTPDMLEDWFTTVQDYPQLLTTTRAECNLQIRQLLFNCLTPYQCPALNRWIVTLRDRVNRAVYMHQQFEAEQDAPADKRREQNRQAVARHRARMRNDGSPEALHAQAVKSAYDKYLEACRQRKEAVAQWAQYVADQKAAWERLRDNGPNKQVL